MQMQEDRQLLQPIAISHFGYSIPLYVIFVLKQIVVMKINCKDNGKFNEYFNFQ